VSIDKERMMPVPSVRCTLALTVVLVIPAATAAADVTTSAPTFTKDVAPIFQAKCESCHRTDNMAPMSLATYEEVRPWAKSIAARIESRQMPPRHIDKTVGIQKFKNDRSLSDDGRDVRCAGRVHPEAPGQRSDR